MKKFALLTLLCLLSCSQVYEGESVNAGRYTAWSGAKYQDGEYTFYFKNGKSIDGDCDGYDLLVDGKTTIYEYFKSGIEAWKKRLTNAGIPFESYRTSSLIEYCWVKFDTNTLKGVAVSNVNEPANTFLYKGDKYLKFDSLGIDYTKDVKYYYDNKGDLRVHLMYAVGWWTDKPVVKAMNDFKNLGLTIKNKITGDHRTELYFGYLAIEPDDDIFFYQEYILPQNLKTYIRK